MFLRWRKKKIRFKCSQCGEIHDDWPAITNNAPWHYHQLTEEEKNTISNLDSDFCEIKWKEQTDRFIRVVLVIPVNDTPLDLEYGLWVSLSESSFKDYDENCENLEHETGYFGWICNKLTGYKDTLQVPADVIVKNGTQRPLLHLHENHDHPLVYDFLKGISKDEAERRIHEVLNNK